MSESERFQTQIKEIILDIEGTTTPIDFVHKVLFPYSKERLADFVVNNFTELEPHIAELEIEHSQERSYSHSFDRKSADSVSNYLKYLIEVDRKSKPLKSIQGQIWESGYRSGELVSPMYADVPEALERWNSSGITISIYSSGSILAQKLLFTYTVFGDLSGLISRHFDTGIGNKRDAKSYIQILNVLDIEPEKVLFLSDSADEVKAAAEAGLAVILVNRDAAIDKERRALPFAVVQNFDGLP